MAAPRRMGSRLSQREERAGSAESWFTSSASLAPVAPEPPVSPGPVAEPPGKNLWEQICEEYEAEVPPFPEEYKVKPEAVMTQVSPLEETVFRGFRAEQLFPVSQSPTASRIPCPQVKEETVDPKTCSPREFLETFIFPILLPGMTNLLHQAKKEKCFERKKTKFVACDFLTEWLYNHNPKRTEEPFTEFFSIPFVEQWLQLQLAACHLWLCSTSLFILGPRMKEWPLPQSHGRGRRAGASPCNGRHYFCSQFIGQYKSPGQAWDQCSREADRTHREKLQGVRQRVRMHKSLTEKGAINREQ
ncbi:IQ domain-containing protein K isoform X4 [Equus caballus]|uniref:IQ domain-containing protein K isoform X4 n=1 Tax=Equus caballus TaxID=9796 RepID=UPI0038B23450